MNILLFAFFTIVTILYLLSIWDIKRSNPVFYFTIFNWILASSSLLLLDLSVDVDRVYSTIIFVSFLMFGLGSSIGIKTFNIRKKYHTFFNLPLEADSNFSSNLILLVMLFSVVVVVLYYRVIGYNLSYAMLLDTGLLDFKSMRIATYSGDNYYAPGLVNQFKNVVLPISFAILSMEFFTRNKILLFYSSLIIFVIFLLYALLGTGQRAPILYAFISIAMGLSIIYKIRVKWIIILSSILILGFGFISLNSGRIDEGGNMSMVSSIFVRIFVVDQLEGLLGFRYIYELKTVWFSEWMSGVLGILPGHSGSDLDHVLYSRLHGTTRGTSSLSIPASVYYNGSMISVFIFYFLFGFSYIYLYARLISGRKTIIRCLGYGGIIFLISVFVMGSPVTLLNKGILGFILILLIRKLRIS